MTTIDDQLRHMIREEIARALGEAGADEYSSDHLPPGIATRKAYARICASGVVPGAWQDGTRGPWHCSRAAWHAARRRTPRPRLELVSSQSDEDVAAAALAAAGLRGSR